MQYESTERIESKAVPGIAFVINRMVEGYRIELRKKAAPITLQIRPLAREVAELQRQMHRLLPRPDMDGKVPDPPPPPPPEFTTLRDRASELVEQIDFLEHTEMEPIYIGWGLKQIEGDLVINGEPASPGNIAFGPPDLYREIVTAIQDRLGLNQEATKNSSSLTTSNGPVAGTTSDTTAASASTTNSTVPETALATSPAT